MQMVIGSLFDDKHCLFQKVLENSVLSVFKKESR